MLVLYSPAYILSVICVGKGMGLKKYTYVTHVSKKERGFCRVILPWRRGCMMELITLTRSFCFGLFASLNGFKWRQPARPCWKALAEIRGNTYTLPSPTIPIITVGYCNPPLQIMNLIHLRVMFHPTPCRVKCEWWGVQITYFSLEKWKCNGKVK